MIEEYKHSEIERFYLYRKEDESGVSGTGIVAVGAIYPSGICIMEWLSFESSINQYRNLEHLKNVHGHNGKTEVIMGTPSTNPPPKSMVARKKLSKKKVTRKKEV